MDELQNQAEQPHNSYRELPIKDFSYVNGPGTQKNKSSKAKLLIIIVGCLVLLGIAGGAYLLLKPSPKKPAQASSSNTSHSTSQTSSSQIFLSSTPKNYYSTGFNLSVNYPSSWTVSDNGSSSLIFTSPVVSLSSDLNKSTPAKVLVSVLPQGQLPTTFGTSGAVAVLASQLIKYSSPTQTQRGQTYVSFVQYPATTVLGGLDAIYITGNDGYTKTQTIPNTDIAGVNPLIIVSFENCQSGTCTSQTPLTINSTMWSNSNFSSEILSILKSFAFN